MEEKREHTQLDSLNEFNFSETAVLAGIVHMHELIALKPVCENLGLNWSGAHQRINRDPQMAKLCVQANVISKEGSSRSMVCMDPLSFQAWLYNLNLTDNLNIALWEEYKKGLVVYLLMMLRISLDEVNRLRHVESEHRILKSMVTEYIHSNEEGKKYTQLAKGKFKESLTLQKDILDRMNGENLDQLRLL